MKSQIRPIAISIAVIIFFVMASVGAFGGLSPATCASRAFVGAIIAYIIISLAAQAVMGIIINSIVDSKIKKAMEKEKNK